MGIRLLPLLFAAALSVGCAASAEEDATSSDEALSQQTLSAAACKTPVLHTKPSMNGGVAIEGTANTTISGCIVGKAGEDGKPGESGKDVTARLVTVLGDTARIGHVRAPSGDDVFAKFTPLPATGTLATGLVQDVDVTLEMFASPSARLRITRKLSADGVYSLRITNVTAFKASVAFVPVTAILPSSLLLEVQMRPEANGLSVSGAGSVKLEIMQDEAAGASELVRDLFNWLTGELAR